ncbi:MAG: glyoxalase [Gammaproteobacteria bacterium]|nr:MAG: glyoxalase [Gammaproteobacteria bacterium]
MSESPKPLSGMRHVALFVKEFAACEAFYVDMLGMKVEWRPDDDNLYLTSGWDNLALHRADDIDSNSRQRLDHIGFIIDEIEQVDIWYEFLLERNIEMKTKPRTHRDGARSFYCLDPDGTMVQFIYHPPISGKRLVSSS